MPGGQSGISHAGACQRRRKGAPRQGRKSHLCRPAPSRLAEGGIHVALLELQRNDQGQQSVPAHGGLRGYKRKLYVLTWPDGHELAGLEVTTKGLPVKKLFELVQLSGQLTGEGDVATKVAVADELFAGFAARLVSWNLEDDDDAPVPATLAGVND